MMLPSCDIEVLSAAGAELDEVLLHPLDHGLLVVPPLPRLRRHTVQQPVQPDDQTVRLRCVPVNPLRADL